MSYEAKCAEVVCLLIDHLNQVVEDNDLVFDEWLSNGDAITDIGELYTLVFTDVFGSHIITEALSERVYSFGMNLVFAIQAGRCVAGDMESLKKLGASFIVNQIDALHIWCDEIETELKRQMYGEF